MKRNLEFEPLHSDIKGFPFSIFHKTLDKAGYIKENHWHDHIQVYLLKQGRALIHCNANPITVSAGDVLVINSYEWHHMESLHPATEYYLIKIDLPFLFSHQMDICQTRYILPLAQNRTRFCNMVGSDPAIHSLLSALISEYEKKQAGFELACKGYACTLIAALYRDHLRAVYTEKESTDEIERVKRLQAIFNYIEANLSEKIIVSRLAELAGFSNSHFCRLFKSMTGKSAVDYINQLRVEKAHALLSSHGYSVTEAAMAAGFDDTNYFSRIYKAYMGTSPSQTRQG